MEYFRVFANCRIVDGPTRSIICDLQFSRFIYIPKRLSEILTYNEVHSLSLKYLYLYCSDEENGLTLFIDLLIKSNFGFITDYPELFPPIPYEWDYPAVITNSIADFDDSTHYNINKFYSELTALYCRAIQIRFYPPISSYKAVAILDELALYKNFDFVEIALPFELHHSLVKNNSCHDYTSRITVYNSPRNMQDEVLAACRINYVSYNIIDEACCGNISKDRFVVNVSLFTESLSFNSCLNRKISVDKYGKIKNCTTFSEHYGSIDEVALKEVVLNNLFKSFWTRKKDDICCGCLVVQRRVLRCRIFYFQYPNAKPLIT